MQTGTIWTIDHAIMGIMAAARSVDGALAAMF
jgi:hypothetical protein